MGTCGTEAQHPFDRGRDGAILKVVRAEPSLEDVLAQCKAQGRPFSDPHFPPQHESIGPFDLTFVPAWARISELSRLNQSQRAEGGCVGESLFALKRVGNSLRHLLRQGAESGVFLTTLRKQGIRQEVLVDDFVPFHKQKGIPAFVQAEGNEVWPLVLEKALAKLYGSYYTVRKAGARNVLHAFSSGAVLCLSLGYPNSAEETQAMEEVWLNVKHSLRNCAVCATTSPNPNLKQTGLVPGHAYTVLDVKQISDQLQELRLLELRTTQSEKWQGKCSEYDKQFWRRLSPAQREELRGGQGTFLMPWEDFIYYFKEVAVLREVESYSYNFVTVQARRRRGNYFWVKFKGRGTAYFSLHQDCLADKPQFVRESSLTALTLIVGRVTKQGLKYVASRMSAQFEHLTLEVDAVEGDYLVYAKAPWRLSEEAPLTLSVYSASPALIESANRAQCKNYLPEVIYDYVANKEGSKHRQYLGEKQQDWFATRLLIRQFGMGVVVAHSNYFPIRVTASEAQFNRAGFVLKKPYRGAKSISAVSQLGKPLVLLSRVLPDGLQSKFRFPPQGLSVKLVE